MPEIDFTPENRIETTPEFDRLKLKKDERARILLLDKPTFSWVHTLRAPRMEDGVPVMVTKPRKGRPDESYTTYDYEFVGRPHCLGDHGIIADTGSDPANCPACKRAGEGDQVNPPERRFAVNVIRYALRADGKLVSPFSCSALVWTFTENTFTKLIDIQQEYANSGGVIKRDLLLGPCTSETFQNYEIHAGAQNVWQADEQITERVLNTYRENAVKDLEMACGRRVERGWMEKDLDRIAVAWRQVNRYEKHARRGTDTDLTSDVALAEGLDDLIGSTTAQGTPAPPAASNPTPSPVSTEAAAADMDALLNSTAAPAPTPGTGATFNFDDLLNSL